MCILLTGSTGFLGSYLLKKLSDSGHQVVALKRSSSNTYRVNEYLDRVHFYDIDKIDISDLFCKHKINVVINTVTNYGRGDSSITSIVNTNLLFGLRLLEESVNSNVSAFINTDTLLDKNINAYALSKSQLVDWLKLFSENKNTKIINVKIEHMYGYLDDENKFIYWLVNQIRKKVDIIDLTSGEQKRDFVYIDDVVAAYEVIISNISKFSEFEGFEIGTGKSVTVRSFVERVRDELGKQELITTILNFGAKKYRKNEYMNMQADIHKLTSYGWSPKISVEDGIKRILDKEDKHAI